MSDALSEERLDEIRADIQDDAVGEERELLAEVERLRDGIEALADSWEPVGGRWLQQMDSEDHVRVDCGEQMLALLNPPTEGES